MRRPPLDRPIKSSPRIAPLPAKHSLRAAIRDRRRLLSQPDIGLAYHASPLLHFRRHEGAKLLRRILARLDVELLEARGDIALSQHRVQAGIELADDLRGRSSGHEHAVP